jgi:hypothetical protein
MPDAMKIGGIIGGNTRRDPQHSDFEPSVAGTQGMS